MRANFAYVRCNDWHAINIYSELRSAHANSPATPCAFTSMVRLYPNLLRNLSSNRRQFTTSRSAIIPQSAERRNKRIVGYSDELNWKLVPPSCFPRRISARFSPRTVLCRTIQFSGNMPESVPRHNSSFNFHYNQFELS